MKVGRGKEKSSMGSFSLWKCMLIGVLGFAIWHAMHSQDDTGKIAARLSGEVSTDELPRLAADVKADDIVIYTTSTCPNSAQAKAWMSQYGFKYTECNAETNAECGRQLQALTDTGVPYLIVRGHHMKDGFDSDEFMAALR